MRLRSWALTGSAGLFHAYFGFPFWDGSKLTTCPLVGDLSAFASAGIIGKGEGGRANSAHAVYISVNLLSFYSVPLIPPCLVLSRGLMRALLRSRGEKCLIAEKRYKIVVMSSPTCFYLLGQEFGLVHDISSGLPSCYLELLEARRADANDMTMDKGCCLACRGDKITVPEIFRQKRNAQRDGYSRGLVTME